MQAIDSSEKLDFSNMTSLLDSDIQSSMDNQFMDWM
jgi:hypothetical protein